MTINKEATEKIYFTSMVMWAFLSLNPFYIWGETPFFQALIAMIGLPLFFWKRSVDLKVLCVGFLSSILVFLFYYFYGASLLGCIYFFFSYLVFYCLSRPDVDIIFKQCRIFIACLLFPGILIWLVHHISGDKLLFSLGPLPAYKMPDPLKLQAGVGYVVYPMTVVLDYMLKSPFYRFFGFFDEPGALGTFAALMLAADRFSLKSFSNLVIFVSGLLSLSMAFFVLAFIYFVFEAIRGDRKSIFLIIFMMFMVVISSQNDYLKTQVYDRFSYGSEGLVGDNRNTAGFNEAFAEWERSDMTQILFGSDKQDDSGSASFKKIPFQSGILGTFFFAAGLLLFSLRQGLFLSISGVSFLLLLCFSILQRPLVLFPGFLLLIAAAGSTGMKDRNFSLDEKGSS